MANNYNSYNRQDPGIGPWSSPQNSQDPNFQYASPGSQSPGFRNPWYSPTNPGAGMNLPPQGSKVPLLGSKNPSFTNNLPVTYEDAAQQHRLLAPFIQPPTRADNPFDHYYTSKEVRLNNIADRRMSAAVDGLLYNPYLMPTQGGVVAEENPADYAFMGMQNLTSLNSGARRSSVAIGASQYPSIPTAGRYLTTRVGQNSVATPYYAQPLPTPQSVTPKARKVCGKNDLLPKRHVQPRYRRRLVNLMHISPVNALSVYLTESYAICQPQKFRYSKTTNPKRVLTKPSKPKYNNGNDNEDSDYILYVNDILGLEEGRKYVVLDLLGSGTFGQVVKCQNLANQSLVAVKVIKSKPAYLNQSLYEIKMLEFLNQNSQAGTFIRLLDTFMHKEHLCLVFEILASNLYELIKQNQFRGLNMKLVKVLTRQLLDSFAQLKSFQIIHCDLKPENILLVQPEKADIKVIDFGSACFTGQTVYSYIQSRFYRSPEVILGLPYTESIDMWSLGCIVGELFLGLPMFPGSSEYNQIYKITDMLGLPPRHMLELGRNTLNFFDKVPSSDPHKNATYKLKLHEAYVEFSKSSKGKEDIAKAEQPNKNYFNQRKLPDIIMNYKMHSRKMTQSMIDKENQDRELLVDFLTKVLNLNPLERMTPQEALKHPFVNDRDAKSYQSSTSSASS